MFDSEYMKEMEMLLLKKSFERLVLWIMCNEL